MDNLKDLRANFLKETLCTVGKILNQENDLNKISEIGKIINTNETVKVEYVSHQHQRTSYHESLPENLAIRLDKQKVIALIDERWMASEASRNNLFNTMLNYGLFHYCLLMIDKYLEKNKLKLSHVDPLYRIINFSPDFLDNFKIFFDYLHLYDQKSFQQEHFYSLIDKMLWIKQKITRKKSILSTKEINKILLISANYQLETIFKDSLDKLNKDQFNEEEAFEAICHGANKNILNYFLAKLKIAKIPSKYYNINLKLIRNNLLHHVSNFKNNNSFDQEYSIEKLDDLINKHLYFIEKKISLSPADFAIIFAAHQKKIIRDHTYHKIKNSFILPNTFPYLTLLEKKYDFLRVGNDKRELTENEWLFFEKIYIQTVNFIETDKSKSDLSIVLEDDQNLSPEQKNKVLHMMINYLSFKYKDHHEIQSLLDKVLIEKNIIIDKKTKKSLKI